MNNMYTILFLLINILVNSQNDNCNELKYGSFESYTYNKQQTGVFYRKGKYQVEKDLIGSEYFIAKIKSKKCLFFLKSYNINRDLDTITMLVTYKKIKDGYYSYVARPAFLKISYSMNGEIKKVSNKIDKKILKIFNELPLLGEIKNNKR